MDPALLALPHQELVLLGVDTIANVSINEHLLGHTDNMFRRWTFNVSGLLRPQSGVRMAQLNPHAYARAYKAKLPYPFPSNGDATFVRKAQSDFGWDWSPAFVNLGLWKDVELRGFRSAVMVDLTVTQLSYEDVSDAFRRQWGLRDPGDVCQRHRVHARGPSGRARGAHSPPAEGGVHHRHLRCSSSPHAAHRLR